MGLEAVVLYLDQCNGDIGAMVGYALVVAQKIVEHKSKLDRAGAGLKSGDMAHLDLSNDIVDDLLKRLDLACKSQIVVLKRLSGNVQYLGNRGGGNGNLPVCRLGEADVLVVHLLCDTQQVYRVVAETFKLADGMEYLGYLSAVGVGQFLA